MTPFGYPSRPAKSVKVRAAKVPESPRLMCRETVMQGRHDHCFCLCDDFEEATK